MEESKWITPSTHRHLSKLHKDPFKTIIRHQKRHIKNKNSQEKDKESGINPEETEVGSLWQL